MIDNIPENNDLKVFSFKMSYQTADSAIKNVENVVNVVIDSNFYLQLFSFQLSVYVRDAAICLC